MPRGFNIYDEALIQRRLWTPDIMFPHLWLDANDLSTISVQTGISEWGDKSGNQRNFTQGTGAAQPTLTLNGLNGRNVLSYSGSQYLTSISTASTWDFLHNTNGSSVFALWKVGNNSNPNAVYALLGNNAGATGNIGYYIVYDDRATSSRNDRATIVVSRGVTGTSTVSNQTADLAHPANTPVIISSITDPNNATATNRSLLSINGGNPIQNNASTLSPSLSNATFTLQIGAAGNNTILFTGYIAEIVILSSIASSSTVQLFEGYFAWKWGVTINLPANHRFKNCPPLIGD